MTPLSGPPDLVCPYLAVDEAALHDNVRAMARWCADRGILLAPHSKTSMSPYVVEAQLAAGAWGLTVATVAQGAAIRSFTEAPLMIANAVVGGPELAWLGEARGQVLSWVDSIEQVDALDRAVAGRSGPLEVLVEVGMQGGRGGARTVAAARAVARRIGEARHLRLRGVAAYEGSYGAGPEPLTGVDCFLDRVEEVVRALDGVGALDDLPSVMITAGGSLYFDRCVRLHGLRLAGGRSTELVLRSGCYALHDDGLYARATPRARGVSDAPKFRSAVAVVARVQSRPEPGLVIVGAGRRDLAYDQDLPVVLSCWGREGEQQVTEMRVDRLDDQHAYVLVPDHAAVTVGDTITLGISHPCSVLDRWRTFQIVRDDAVVGVGETLF